MTFDERVLQAFSEWSEEKGERGACEYIIGTCIESVCTCSELSKGEVLDVAEEQIEQLREEM